MRRRYARERDDLVGAGEGRRRVHEAAREAHGALPHRVVHHGSHARHLRGGRGAVGIAHHVTPRGSHRHEGAEVDGWSRGFERAEVAIEVRPGHARAAGGVELVQRVLVDRYDARDLAGDLARDPLRDLGDGASVAEQRVLGVAEHVDEARGDDEVRGVDRVASRGAGQQADRNDAVARDEHVAAIPRAAGAVHDLAIADDQVGGGDAGNTVRLGRALGGCACRGEDDRRSDEMESAFHAANIAGPRRDVRCDP